VMMPHVDGSEFCRRIKGDPVTAPIPFIMLTAKVGLEMKIDGLHCGADDYLMKPFDERELKARVRSLLRLRRLNLDLDKRNCELQEAYREVTTMQSQLIHAEKMSSLGQLVAGLAHEINNAINAVYNGIKPLRSSTDKLDGLLSRMARDAGDKLDPAMLKDIAHLLRRISSLGNVIEHGAVRTVGIVTDLKTFSHPGTEGFEDFDLRSALDICVNLLLSQTKDGIQVHKDYGNCGEVHGPSGQLNQVFLNILQNAQQAMQGQGEIFIRAQQEADTVRVAIRDTGSGISEEIQQRIFDPFFTTKPPGVGTGLGLSVSYGIISRLGGAISCHSRPGEGAEFVITFPRVSKVKDPSGPEPQGKVLKLLGTGI